MTAPTGLQPGLHRARRSTAMRWLKHGAVGALGLAVVAAIVVAYLPKPVVVDVDSAKRGWLDVTVSDDGKTRVRDRYVVAAPLTGTLARVELDAGAHVDAGATVAQIAAPEPALLDPRSRNEATARLAGALAQQRQAAAAITRATAARDLAVREADRARRLLEHGAITATERDRMELNEKLAIGDLAAAEQQGQVAAAEVTAARALLDTRPQRDGRTVPVIAPTSGTILRVVRDSEGPITVGAPIVEIGDPQALEVVVDVLSSDAARIPIGAPAKIAEWGGERPLAGHVKLVEPSAFTRVSALGIEEQRVNVVIDLDEVPPELGDGFRVVPEIQLWRGDVLEIPMSALFRDHGHWAVYAIERGRVAIRPVEIGHRGALMVEIIKGLTEGERVVLHPSDAVREGVRVEPR